MTLTQERNERDCRWRMTLSCPHGGLAFYDFDDDRRRDGDVDAWIAALAAAFRTRYGCECGLPA